MIKRYCLHLAWLIVFLIIALYSSDSHGGIMITHKLESLAIAKNKMGISSLRSVLVYIPDEYDKGNQSYPVIYWINGWAPATQGIAKDEYRKPLDDAIQSGKIPPTIAVFPDVETEVGGTVFLNSTEFGNWEDFLVNELVPFIDKTHRTIPDMRKRAIMGWSVGGYDALILPILHPNVWIAIGANDPSIWMGCYMPAVEELPAKIEDSGSDVNVQLGVTISPNPDVPIRFDAPIKAGNLVPEIAQKWEEYCLISPNTIAKHYETLSKLSMIAIVTPDVRSDSNWSWVNPMINTMNAANISVTHLDMPGGHYDFRGERFIALAEQVLKAMEKEVVVAVSGYGKITTVWGEIKR